MSIGGAKIGKKERSSVVYGDYASGQKRLETVIDFRSEEFVKAWAAGCGEMLRLGTVPLPLFSKVAYPVILEVVLKCDIEHAALDAFAKTDMKGKGWLWNFYIEDIPTEVVEPLWAVSSKVHIVSTAWWRVSAAGEDGKFLTVNIGDFAIFPVKEETEQSSEQ